MPSDTLNYHLFITVNPDFIYYCLTSLLFDGHMIFFFVGIDFGRVEVFLLFKTDNYLTKVRQGKGFPVRLWDFENKLGFIP